MKIDQLPLFLRRSFQKKPPAQILKPVTPTGESSVMQTLVAFQAFVAEKYAPKTAKMYFGDVREGLDQHFGHFRPPTVQVETQKRPYPIFFKHFNFDRIAIGWPIP
jgi:hypothetical protein